MGLGGRAHAHGACTAQFITVRLPYLANNAHCAPTTRKPSLLGRPRDCWPANEQREFGVSGVVAVWGESQFSLSTEKEWIERCDRTW